jgi:dTDP-4-amino-4,6-dideoxygalactose transaminase
MPDCPTTYEAAAMTQLPAILDGSIAFPDGLPLVRPTLEDVPGLARRIEAILRSGYLTDGPTVKDLEARLADRLEVPYVVAVASCTAGLMLVLQALDATGPVVMPSFTFAASAHAIHWVGGTPVFAEVEPTSLTLDPDDASRLVSGASAMTATHVYGTPCDTERLQAVADRERIPLVYDAAHGLGSRHAGRPIGGFGTAEVFSLSPTKVMVGGEGGIVATHDESLADQVRLGRGYGNPGNYDCVFPGLNARMSELHAAIALSSLEHLDERIAHRNHLVQVFLSAIAGIPGLRMPSIAPGDLSTFKDLTLIVDREAFGLSSTQLGAALKVDGIDSRRYYYPPIHQQKAYSHLARIRELPVTDDIANRVLTLPLWSHMTDNEVMRVADAVVVLHRHSPAVRERLTTTNS